MSHAQPAVHSEVVHCQAGAHDPVAGPLTLPLTQPRAPQKPQPACSVHEVHVAYAAQGSAEPQSGSHAQPVWQPPPVSHEQELPMHATMSEHTLAAIAQLRWSAVVAGQSLAHEDVSMPAQIEAMWLHTVVHDGVGVGPPPPRRELVHDATITENVTRTTDRERLMCAVSAADAPA